MNITPDQFQQILQLLGKIADKQYAITGATDWQMLFVLGGVFVLIFSGAWADLRGSLKGIVLEMKASLGKAEAEWKSALREHEAAEEKQFDHVWNSQRDCQKDCCPPRIKQNAGQDGGSN